MLKARDTGKGPIFTEGQLLRLSEWCKQRSVDSSEFVPAYTDYVIAEFSVKDTGAEMAAHVELAVTQVPDPKVVLELYQKRQKRRPSGESPKEKLERSFRALEHEKTRAQSAHDWNEGELETFSACAHQAWQLYTSQLSQTVQKLGWGTGERQQYWDEGYKIYMTCSVP